MTTKLIRALGATALILTLGTTVVLASGSVPAETRAQVTEKLTAQGYDVRKIKMEDGMIEVYALKDGKKLELYLDQDLNVAKTKAED